MRDSFAYVSFFVVSILPNKIKPINLLFYSALTGFIDDDCFENFSNKCSSYTINMRNLNIY